MRHRRSTKAAFALAAGLFASAADGRERDRLGAFLSTYHCEIVGRLGQIHASSEKASRYIILSDASRPEHYVQCLFIEDDARMLCEVASGFYLTRPEESRIKIVSPQGLSALERLGFSGDDAKGNFQTFVRTATAVDFPTVADLMLTALYRGYEKREPPRLKIDAPLGPGERRLRTQCAPVS